MRKVYHLTIATESTAFAKGVKPCGTQRRESNPKRISIFVYKNTEVKDLKQVLKYSKL